MGIGLLTTSIEQGLVYAILAMGVYITSEILKIADLSVEGSFPLGAFIFARLVIAGQDPVLATLAAFFFGSLAGLMTSIFFTKFKINSLLSGILTMNILYSINIRINDTSNVPLYGHPSIFDHAATIPVLIATVIGLKLVMDWFLKTEIGYLLVATGDNETLVKSLGKNSDHLKTMGLMLANGLIALSGALMGQLLGFVDVTMGKATIVVALSAIIIGQTLFRKAKILKATSRVVIGAIIYKIIGGLALNMGLRPSDLTAINATILIVFLVYNNFFLDLFNREFKKKGEGEHA